MLPISFERGEVLIFISFDFTMYFLSSSTDLIVIKVPNSTESTLTPAVAKITYICAS